MTTTSAAAAEIKRVALNRLFYAPNSSEYGRHDEPVVGWDMIIFGGLHIHDDAVLNICITKDRPPSIHPSIVPQKSIPIDDDWEFFMS